MNIDWSWFLVPGLSLLYLGSCYLYDHRHDLRNLLARAEAEEAALQARFAPYVREEAESIPVGDGMPNIAMRTGMAWPRDLCAYPPCDLEDGWICTWHDPRGQCLRYGPEPIIALPEPDDEWWWS